jgi:hypothetical protein
MRKCFFLFSRALEVLFNHQNPGLLPIYTSYSTPQRALTSAYGVSPHRLPGKSQKGYGPFRKKKLEAKREIDVQGGGDYSCRLDITQRLTNKQNNKYEREKQQKNF